MTFLLFSCHACCGALLLNYYCFPHKLRMLTSVLPTYLHISSGAKTYPPYNWCSFTNQPQVWCPMDVFRQSYVTILPHNCCSFTNHSSVSCPMEVRTALSTLYYISQFITKHLYHQQHSFSDHLFSSGPQHYWLSLSGDLLWNHLWSHLVMHPAVTSLGDNNPLPPSTKWCSS